jgi:hydroxymethylpyrimidine/phosphomethylpyrimidine kinase
LKAAPARLLIVAGSDSSGGAGIQADIKTASALGVYAMTAVTAVTVQDTTRVHAIHLIPPSIIGEQIACVLADIGADAIKIGMLGSADAVDAVADALETHGSGVPVVLDPVLTSGSGQNLLDADAIKILKARLFPLATLVTPNIPEAESFTGLSIYGPGDGERAAKILFAQGARAVLIKDGHGRGENVLDSLFVSDTGESYHCESPRIDTHQTHGSGCTLATAIAAGLSQRLSLAESFERAHFFVHAAILTSPGFGSGHGPLNHMHAIGEFKHP